MNPTAIYSKSGKGVQEAAGKTSLLKRPDRAVLSAIDGRATLAEVAQKVGKTFDREFEQLVAQMDKDGFIREVSPGAAPAAKPGAKPAAKPAAPTTPMDAASDLDFSSFAPSPKPASPPPASPRPAAPPPRPAAPPPKAQAPAAPAKEQQTALNKAREEAEAKAAEEREKQKAEAEAKVRAEMEAKLRAEAEEKAKDAAAHKVKADAAAKVQAEADAKIKAARDAAVRAAAEAKAKADAEAKRAREEAEKAKREAEEMKKRLEAERREREEAERKAKEEAERARKQIEEERRKLEEERKRREEEERKKEEERAERRRKEEEEEQARRRQREEEERKVEEEREAKRKQRDDEDRKAEEERDSKRKQREEEQRLADEEEQRQESERVAKRKQEQEERRKREDAEAEAEAEADAQRAAQKKAKAEAKPADPGASFSDTLLSDLDSFGKRDDEERKEKEEAERKSKAEEAKRRAREEEDRKEREEEEERERKRKAKEEAKRKEREEEEAREREEEEAKERKRKEKEEAKRKAEEEEEKKRKKARKGGGDDIPISDDDLDTDDVKRDQRELAKAAKTAPRPKEAPRVKLPPPVSGPSVRRRPMKWGKPVAIVLFLVLAGGLGVAHVMPIDTKPYADAATEALGRPVRIGSGRLWLFGGGIQLKMHDVTVGDAKVANASAFPTLGSLSEPKKVFSRIELDGLTLPQSTAGEALFARAKSDNFSVERLVIRQLQLSGPLALAKNLDADVVFDASGAPSSVNVRGADGLVIKLAPKDAAIDIDVVAGGFAIPIAPEITLSSFAMKASATRQGMQIEKWDGTLLNGNVTGSATVRWGGTWIAEGVFTTRGINAAVFAPALLSEGRGEGTAKFQLSGADPAKLGSGGRFEGTFTVNAGVLGSFDLNQALQTGGKRASGRTPFTEMTGQAVYQAGTLALRNVTITAGSSGNMNAGASLDVAANGALSGRIVADVRTPNQTLRATLNIGGTVKEPQVRN